MVNTNTNKEYRKTFLETSIFTRGIMPSFTIVNVYGSTEYVNGSIYQAEYDKIYDTILYRHPNQDEKLYNFVRSALPLAKAQEPILNTIKELKSIIFSGNNFTISTIDKDIELLFSDFRSRCHDYLMNKIEDPNGYFVVIENHDLPFINVKPEPKILFVASENIIKESESELQFKYDGFFHHLDSTTYIRGKEGGDNKIEAVYGYEHNMGRVPFVKAKGIKCGDFYRSDIYTVIGWAKSYLKEAVDQDLVLKNASYPIPIMPREQCRKCSGSRKVLNTKCGTVTADDKKCTSCNSMGCQTECSDCEGTGHAKYNPGTIITYNPVDAVNQKSTSASSLVAFASPDIGCADHHLKVLDIEKKGLEKSLNIRNIESAQSGEAKALDMKGRQSMFREISDSLYEAMDYILRCAIAIRTYNTETQYTLVKPTNFEVSTYVDLFNDYKLLKDSNANKPALDKARLAAIGKMFPNDAVLLKREELAMYIDKYYHDVLVDFNIKMLNGYVSEPEKLLHNNKNELIQELIDRIGLDAFISAPTKQLSNDIRSKAENP